MLSSRDCSLECFERKLEVLLNLDEDYEPARVDNLSLGQTL